MTTKNDIGRTEGLERDAKNLKFDLLRNALYHGDELWFFLFADRLTKFFSVLVGTAIVGAALRQAPILGASLAFVIAVLQLYGLVFGVSGKAVLHESRRQKYFSLLADLEREKPNPDLILRIRSEMTRTWGEEPPIYWAVDALAWNSALNSMKSDIKAGELIKIQWWEKVVRHLWRFSPEHFRGSEYSS